MECQAYRGAHGGGVSECRGDLEGVKACFCCCCSFLLWLQLPTIRCKGSVLCPSTNTPPLTSSRASTCVAAQKTYPPRLGPACHPSALQHRSLKEVRFGPAVSICRGCMWMRLGQTSALKQAKPQGLAHHDDASIRLSMSADDDARIHRPLGEPFLLVGGAVGSPTH